MTPYDFDSELERLGHHPRPEYGLAEAWVRLRAATVEAERHTGRVSVRENSAGHGAPGARGLGTRTLRRWLWTGGTAGVGALVAIMLAARHGHSNRTDVTRTYTTTADQQATLRLDDGTRVMLAPQTTLRLVHFGTSSRIVALDHGEAYFEVARTAGTPFVVQSGTVSARVLGTEFLMRHEANDTRVRVSVEEGKVRVTSPSGLRSGVILTPGQIGDVTDSTVQVNTVNDLVPGAERAPGQLLFHDTPVATILQAVSQWYGYQFRYADRALAQRPVTIVISTQSSAEALAAIEQVLAVNVTVVGDTVTLTPQPVRSTRSAPKIRTYDVWTPKREVGR